MWNGTRVGEGHWKLQSFGEELDQVAAQQDQGVQRWGEFVAEAVEWWVQKLREFEVQ